MSKDGGPAFPCPQDCINQNVPSLGMSLRDYFAAAALPACIAAAVKMLADGGPLVLPPTVADGAYHYADAMLAAREKP